VRNGGMQAGRFRFQEHGIKHCRVEQVRGVDIRPRSMEPNRQQQDKRA
jgi:hypothetical protein